MAELAVKPWAVSLPGFDSVIFVARTRGKALAKAWSDYQILGETPFKEFLRIARCRRAEWDGFGKPIKVAGADAFYVGVHGQYVRFVRPNSDEILLSHPADVEGLNG